MLQSFERFIKFWLNFRVYERDAIEGYGGFEGRSL